MSTFFKSAIVSSPAELDGFLNKNTTKNIEDDPRIVGYQVMPNNNILVTIKLAGDTSKTE